MDEEYDRLYRHITNGSATALEEYLRNGGDPNLTNRNGWTLLMASAFKGSLRTLELLLDYGADVNALNIAGESALVLAAGKGRTSFVRYLLQNNASVDVRPLGWSLLHFLEYAQEPSDPVQVLLREAGAT